MEPTSENTYKITRKSALSGGLKTGLLFALMLMSSFVWAKKNKSYYVRIKTDKGESIVRLYDQTPKHRDNFIKLVKDKTLNKTLFHRVIKEFMIQGGDPDSKNAKPGEMLGSGSLPYTIPAEFDPELFHKKGALAAARDNNPEKASNATQFYLVQGKTFTDEELNSIEKYRMNGAKLTDASRKAYKTVGGVPFLDQNYTVFGEVVKGVEMVDAIAAVPTDRNDRPVTDISMELTLLKKKEVKRLEKELLQEAFRRNLIMNKK